MQCKYVNAIEKEKSVDIFSVSADWWQITVKEYELTFLKDIWQRLALSKGNFFNFCNISEWINMSQNFCTIYKYFKVS